MIRPALPRWVVLPAAAAAVFLAVPLVAMLFRVPWARLPALLAAPEATDALWLSLRTCTLTTLVALVLGLPLDECSVKIRTGGPEDVPEDVTHPDFARVWAGTVPLHEVFGTPVRSDECLAEVETPAYVREWSRG